MGIKFLQSFLRNHPELRHSVVFEWSAGDGDSVPLSASRRLLVWDAAGWLRRCFRCHSRASKLFSDFKVLDRECKNLMATFKRIGFEVVAFIDGRFCADKVHEKRSRKLESLRNIRRNIKLLRAMHATASGEERESLLGQMQWVPSSGYFHFLEQALTASGCTVYRGTGGHDVDRDIARFVVEHKDAVFGVMSCDSDFFGFADLPDTVKLIGDFQIKTEMARHDEENGAVQKKRAMLAQTLSMHYHYSADLWEALGLRANAQRLELICFVGNDFVRKRSSSEVLKLCGIDPEQAPSPSADHGMDSEHKETEGIQQKTETLPRDEAAEQKKAENHCAAEPKDAAAAAFKYDAFEVAARAILNGDVQRKIIVPDFVVDFYSIDSTKQMALEDNVNPTFSDLMGPQRVFSGGFFFHDIDSAGFGIHQKLTAIRHALIRKYLKLDDIIEYIPVHGDGDDADGDDDGDEGAVSGNVNVWKHRVVDLKRKQHDRRDLAVVLQTEWMDFGAANLYFVFKNALQILSDRGWIQRVQSIALELQFQIRFRLRSFYGKWPFYAEYKDFLKNGVPVIRDLTAQCLYWECARTLCLNEKNLMPPIHRLFDGPLFHFFCHCQREGDRNGFIQEMLSKLRESEHGAPRRGGHRATAFGRGAFGGGPPPFAQHRGGRGGPAAESRASHDANWRNHGQPFQGPFVRYHRGGGRRAMAMEQTEQPPLCRFYDGRYGSCMHGQHCRFRHVVHTQNQHWAPRQRGGGAFQHRNDAQYGGDSAPQ